MAAYDQEDAKATRVVASTLTDLWVSRTCSSKETDEGG